MSLLALVAQIAGGYLLTPLWQATGAAGAVLPALLLVIGVALLRYARRRTT